MKLKGPNAMVMAVASAALIVAAVMYVVPLASERSQNAAPIRPPAVETRLRPPVPIPYLSYFLCALHRLDLLTAKRVRDGRASAMPPFC
jgi:hypothetical protein